ncbi:MAG: hypothetical protein JW725_00960 [Candidatus Babeliaceae bacterium]|nr:hypothetical protein [Candidatus Babeliaceae bacterium]
MKINVLIQFVVKSLDFVVGLPLSEVRFHVEGPTTLGGIAIRDVGLPPRIDPQDSRCSPMNLTFFLMDKDNIERFQEGETYELIIPDTWIIPQQESPIFRTFDQHQSEQDGRDKKRGIYEQYDEYGVPVNRNSSW